MNVNPSSMIAKGGGAFGTVGAMLRGLPTFLRGCLDFSLGSTSDSSSLLLPLMETAVTAWAGGSLSPEWETSDLWGCWLWGEEDRSPASHHQ